MRRDSAIADFYTTYDPLKVTPLDLKEFEKYAGKLDEDEKALLASGYQYYEMKFKSVGGLVMPILLQFNFSNGTSEEVRIPAEIWKKNSEEVSKVFFFEHEVASITLDPHLETADVDVSNNYWPPRMIPNKFELYKGSGRDRYGSKKENPMQKAKKIEELDKGERLQKEE